MKKAAVIFPHQLFAKHDLHACDVVFVVEEYLFFKQYAFHKQKLVLHRSGMKYFSDQLRSQGTELRYIESSQPVSYTHLRAHET